MPSFHRSHYTSSVQHSSPLLTFDDTATQYMSSDGDQMLFGPLDFEEYSSTAPPTLSWDPFSEVDTDIKPFYNFPASSSLSPSYECDLPQPSPTDSGYFDSGGPFDMKLSPNSPPMDSHLSISNWINDPDFTLGPGPSSPIPIPASSVQPMNGFVPFTDRSHFPKEGLFSPTEFAALHPLPRSISPSSSYEGQQRELRERVDSVSPQETSLATPAWASQLWDGPTRLRVHSASRPAPRPSPLSDATVRLRVTSQRGPMSSAQIFQSSSAPTSSEPRAPSMTRSYSRRAESESVSEDRDATVRRKKRSPPAEDGATAAAPGMTPLKSVLRPPKLAPSAWQLYFTDWIQRQQASGARKLNVAQAAKEAGQEYASLSQEEKEPYKRRSQAAKEARERELAAYMKSLTPDDIKRENAFRTAQRKAGKSRKSNIKDPNAPKKPLSAYFMFLQRIRSNPYLVKEVFGEETETTKQSVLAAAKWRSMTDAERQPFLAQAEQEKMEYEAARRLYEEGAHAYGSSNINFSILPGSPSFPVMRLESSSENEDSMVEDTTDRLVRRS